MLINNTGFHFSTTIVSTNLKDNNNDPVLIVDGKSLQENLAIQIIISFFLLVAFLDFIFQTVLLFYVVIKLFLKITTKTEAFYGILGVLIYTLLRSSFLLFFIFPIPWDWAPSVPDVLGKVFMYINLGFFLIFNCLSLFACLYYMIFLGATGKRMKGSTLDEKTGIEPTICILMPIYNEDPDALFRAVESAIRCNYRPDRMHVFLSFDEASETALYFSLLKKLRVLSSEVSEEIKSKLQLISQENAAQREAPIFPPRLEWVIEGVRVTICRFSHEGKSPTQGKTFRIINEIYGEDSPENVANTLVLFIDSDIILHENAIHNFVVATAQNPKIKGLTGLVTCRTSRTFNIYQYLQDAEYIDGQMFSRTAEATLGAVTCLPGALTLIRLNALKHVAPKYFVEIDKRQTVDFHRFHLGEDRYMTYLLTEEAEGLYEVGFMSNVTCKTDAPDTFSKLLKQRRRWFLGGFVNDVSMIISPTMWRKVPLVVFKTTYFYSSRGLSWILPVMFLSLFAAESPGLSAYFIFIIFTLRFTLLGINTFMMARTKVALSFIFLFFLSPLFDWVVNIYAAWTWNVRSWGGPRTEDGDGELQSKAAVLDEVMAKKEEKIGKTRKSLGQIKTMSRRIEANLQVKEGKEFGSVNSVKSNGSLVGEAPLKKFVPFPYETEFLGGGDYEMTDCSVVIPPTPKNMSPFGSVRSLRGIPPLAGSGCSAPNFLSPLPGPQGNGSLQYSLSMPDLSTLNNTNAPYLFAKLSPETLRRASSFRLDTDYLAKVEGLAIHENSVQRETSFNMRLSGRMSPSSSWGGNSREPSVYSFDMSGERISDKSDEGEGGFRDANPWNKDGMDGKVADINVPEIVIN